MKSKIDWVRRSQRVIRMVSELHRMGYQHLRIMPYEHPNAWRLAIGPKNIFSGQNGAYIPLSSLGEVPIYSSARGNEYFDWNDAKSDNARDLAEKFVSRFPDIAERGLGRDWAYAGWLAELISLLEGGDYLPVVYWEYMKGTPEELTFLPIWDSNEKNGDWADTDAIPNNDVRNFPLPPSLQEDTDKLAFQEPVSSSSEIILLRIAGEGGELDLTLRMTESGIFSYNLKSNSSESWFFDDEDIVDKDFSRDTKSSNSPLVIDWHGALKLLDDQGWPWPLLTPIFIHPSIRWNVMNALKDRYSRYPEIDFARWDSIIHKVAS